MSYRHGLDVRGSPASEDRSRCATVAEDGVGSRYQAAHSEDMEDLMRAMVNCKECSLAIAL
jgi:ubiquitin